MADHTDADWRRINAALDRALDLPPEQRLAFVRRDYAGDAALLAELESLIAAANRSVDFLSSPPVAHAPADHAALQAGDRVGPWQVGERIGRGGMGDVYRGQRVDGGYAQRAAIKLLHADAVGHAARFDAERRILAGLEHPGIARLYDGGVDAQGRAYMAMEFVAGRPITEFCRDAPLAKRLQLFAQVCDAVTYAHSNLVVHRDIKPANVFVSDSGQVKLLDFGIAKLLDVDSSDSTLTQAPLTPAYAAPEQLAGKPVTTATDVYALGVLLFELLTGTRPWAEAGAPMAQTLLAVLERPAPVPSRQAANTSSPPVPARQLMGDLDAIVAKALRKEPEYRYATVNALRLDIERTLRGEAVAAREGARMYAIGRTVRRYRWAAVAVVALVAALTAGIIGTAWQAQRAAAERDRYEAEAARSNAILDYVSSMFETASNAAGSAPVAAKDVLADSAAHLEERFAHRPADYARVVEFIGGIYSNFGDEEGAVPMERRFLSSPAAAAYPDVAGHVRIWLAQSLMRQGNLDGADATLKPAQAYWRQDQQRNRHDLAKTMIIQGQVQKARGDVDGALVTLRSALPDAVGDDGRDTEDSSNIKNSIALALMVQGAFDDADRLMADVRAYHEHDGRGDDALLTAIQNQGAIAAARGDYPRAIALLRQAIDSRRKRFGPSGAMAAAELNLAKAEVRGGHPDVALQVLVEAEPIAKQFTGDHSPIELGILQTRAEAQLARGDATAATPWVQQSLDAVRAHGGEKHPMYPMAMALQAQLQSMQGHRDEAQVSIDAAMHALDAMGKGAALLRPQVERIRKTVLSTN